MRIIPKSTDDNRHYELLFAAATFVLVFLAMHNVTLYGDDYYYSTFVTSNSNEFWSKHFHHYMVDNGRLIVHVLASCFLALPPLAWQIFNSLLLGLYVYFGMRIVLGGAVRPNIVQAAGAGVVLVYAIFMQDIELSRQSIYWLTGSFNYVYPLGLLMGYWFLLEHAPQSKAASALLPVLAFLSGASTEQNAVMTVGLGGLYCLDRIFIKKDKVGGVLLLAVAASAAGAMTVILAPATFVRYGLENKEQIPFAQLLFSNLKIQYSKLICARYILPFQLMFCSASALFIFASSGRFDRKKQKALRIFSLLSMVIMALTILACYYQATAAVKSVIVLAVPIAIITLYYLAALLIISRLIFKHKLAVKYQVPVAAFLMCAASQGMMLVSPVFGPRNVLCGILMMAVYSAYLYVQAAELLEWGKDRAITNWMVLAAIMALSIGNMFYTIDGYRTNMTVKDANERLIGEYKSGPNGTLPQYKLILKDYGWSMPYESSYHQVFYKKYYGLADSVNIEWLDSSELGK